MNFHIFNRIRDSSLSSSDKIVAIMILDTIGDNPTGYRGPTSLSVRTSLSIRTVKRSIANLEKAGLIKRRWGGHAAKDYSFVSFDAEAWAAIERSAAEVVSGAQGDISKIDGRDTVSPHPCHGVTPTRVMVTPKPPNEPPKDTAAAPNLEVTGNREITQSGNAALRQQSPFQDAFDLYNAIAALCGWAPADFLTAAHERRFAELGGDFSFGEWTQALNLASKSPWIASEKRKNWPTQDWFLNPHTICKILEGGYHEIWFEQKLERRPVASQLPTMPAAQKLAFEGAVIKLTKSKLDDLIAANCHLDVIVELSKIDTEIAPFNEEDPRRCGWQTKIVDWLSILNGTAAHEKYVAAFADMEEVQ
jgi:DNA-binding MarR family transcriptional regulator